MTITLLLCKLLAVTSWFGFSFGAPVSSGSQNTRQLSLPPQSSLQDFAPFSSSSNALTTYAASSSNNNAITPTSHVTRAVRVKDREIIDRLWEERRAVGFRLVPLLSHPVLYIPKTIKAEPDIAQASIQLLQSPTTLLSAKRHFNPPMSLFQDERRTGLGWHLMTPAPVNERFYEMMGIPYNQQTMGKQPMLLYELVHEPKARMDHVRLIGVEVVQEEESPLSFILRWLESRDVMPFPRVLDNIHGWGRHLKLHT